MSRSRFASSLFLISALTALILGLIPLPGWLAAFKPFWLALVLAYWVLEAPEHVGLGVAFVLGVAADLIFGTLLGEYALRLVVLTFIVQRFRPRLRFFPIGQQSLAVFALLLNDRIVAAAIRVFLGEGLPPLAFWYSPITGLLLWPFLVIFMELARQRGRRLP
ncbi:MAG: rod shape-determining protein MreD [Xanthomonadaceae bacterium]|nr:rod shape-determining protein MreD [Xanthomonadaceae bacterium]MDP2186070.1 rod shape-determining protein MreD [Xanthomonadales bacterium]MDZ4117465.1 rod shape-determining protein MreD [Xanthomonadaceae bacterium]MDZ4378950.1 rod shape-determining protein MreD [Xanthomonadaceae bacterium]